MKKRIREIREYLNLNRTEFEVETGIKAKTWANIENGIQKANEDHIKAIIEIWPEFSYWLTTGMTIEDKGQISPGIEQARQNLKTGTG